jgi:hypothetical protein
LAISLTQNKKIVVHSAPTLFSTKLRPASSRTGCPCPADSYPEDFAVRRLFGPGRDGQSSEVIRRWRCGLRCRSLTASQRLPGPGRDGQSCEGRTRLRGGPGPWATPWPCGPSQALTLGLLTAAQLPRGGCAPPVHSSVAALFETGRLPVVARFKFPAQHVPSLTRGAAAGRPGLPTRLPPVRSTACVDDCVTGPSSCRTRPATTGPTVPIRLTPCVGRSFRVRK